jgi:hypothetical protein
LRKPATIKADIRRYERALDGCIDLATGRVVRPSRAWASACKVMMDRLDGLRAELAQVEKS